MYFTNNSIQNNVSDWDAESTVKECLKLLISVDKTLLGLHKGTPMFVIITKSNCESDHMRYWGIKHNYLSGIQINVYTKSNPKWYGTPK